MKIIVYNGGMGDCLMLSCLCREIKKRDQNEVISIICNHPEVLIGNRDIDHLCHINSRMSYHLHRIYDQEIVEPTYLIGYDSVTDTREPLRENVYCYMSRICGIDGPINPRPYYYGSREIDKERILVDWDRVICVQSSGIVARNHYPNKEWYPARMTDIVEWSRNNKNTTIQIGTKDDPRIGCDIDLCGETSISEVAWILSKCRLFVGLEGFLMHLARAVDCPSVIIYGKRLLPWQIGYDTNINIVGTCPDKEFDRTGCWRAKTCDYNKECMNMITSNMVIEAMERIIK